MDFIAEHWSVALANIRLHLCGVTTCPRRCPVGKWAEDFRSKISDGEYPSSPPHEDLSLHYNHHYINSEEQKRTMVIPTHSTPFICTRWTNIYFPHTKLFWGDFIGGPLQPLFGNGVYDRPVELAGIHNTLLAHTRYWAFKEDEQQKPGCKHPTNMLRHHSRIDCLKGNVKKWPEP